MANTKEIKRHIASVRDTQKITNAMYLIASTKLQRAKNELDRTRPYFTALRTEIQRIFSVAGRINSPYLCDEDSSIRLEGRGACLVITADKGLAGAYNQNALKEAERLYAQKPGMMLFVVGEYGRRYFEMRGIPIEHSFLYTAQNPNLDRAREICEKILDGFKRGDYSEVYLVYTNRKNSMESEAVSDRLLPFHRAHFEGGEDPARLSFEYIPSAEGVLNAAIRSYVSGFVYGALVSSFCCEQNARMTAMSSANDNAQKIIEKLQSDYNRVRQAAITQEITEICAGAKAQQKKKVGSS